jgi:hypothetical protein
VVCGFYLDVERGIFSLDLTFCVVYGTSNTVHLRGSEAGSPHRQGLKVLLLVLLDAHLLGFQSRLLSTRMRVPVSIRLDPYPYLVHVNVSSRKTHGMTSVSIFRCIEQLDS